MRVSTGSRRDGFVLLAVLWVVVGIAALGLSFAMTGRETVGEVRNRVDITRAAWRAEGCAQEARALVADGLTRRATDGAPTTWDHLDGLLNNAGILDPACQVTLRPVGAALNVNTATRAMLRRLFAATDVQQTQLDSLVDALLDWRDVDDDPRPAGAESRWYLDRGRQPPRNGSLADIRELRWVRGFGDDSGWGRWLEVEPGRVSLDHAPAQVLSALPGLGPEAVNAIVQRRRLNRPVGQLDALAAALSPAARDTLALHFAELVPLVTAEPDAWILTSSAGEGTPPVVAVVELRLEKAANRAAVVRRRTWTR